jgi:hypothetical protein
MKATRTKISRKRNQQWQQTEFSFNDPDPYKKAYIPHGHLSEEAQFYSEVSKKRPKPDPATVEAELQLEEQLWNQ